MGMTSTHSIMRRVYMSYALSIVGSTALWQGFLLGASIAAFGRLTHVAAIIENVLATPFGAVPNYVVATLFEATANGELVTVLSVLLMTFLSLLWLKRISQAIIVPRFA